jgi:phosphoserine phosphatase
MAQSAHLISLLPGASAAVTAVRAAGGRAVVVTAKSEALARQALAALGVEVDEVVGGHWAEAKAQALRAHGATVYVGDHPGDVQAARAADALCVGVLTGGEPPVGADVLLDDLTAFPEWFAGHLLDARLAVLDAALRATGGLLVAFSGGADSAFLLAAAARALGPERVVAATAVSASLAADELPAAQALAAALGVRHVTPETDELSREGYVANGPDRCFHCKATLLDTLRPLRSGWTCRRRHRHERRRRRGRLPAGHLRGRPARSAHAAAGRRAHQGAGARGVPPLGPGDRGQARSGLPGEPHRVRHPGDAERAGAGRPRGAGPAGAPG